MGLKDQLMAIKWVNENIHNFGGDVNRVTLHGFSAGSVSAHMHLLSSASKRLFQRAILVSGSVLSSWAISYRNQVPALTQMGNLIYFSNKIIVFQIEIYAAHIAADNGIIVNTDAELIAFLKTADKNQLINFKEISWSPVIERKCLYYLENIHTN